MPCPFRLLAVGTLLLVAHLHPTVGRAQSSQRLLPDSTGTRSNLSLKDTTYQPIFIVNGKQASIQSMSKLTPSSIEKVDVLKGETALKQYGERGKNGVVLITLKASFKDTVPAYFPAGLDGWRRYLERNLQYPIAAQEKKTQGKVSVQMIVDEQGKITGAEALNDPGDGLAAEAVRVVKSGPDWVAATVNGKPVPFGFKQKITFQLGAVGNGAMPVNPMTNLNRFNQRVVIKTPRLYNGQAVAAITPTYDRTGLDVLTTTGRSYFLNSQEAMQMFGIAVSNEGFVIPEDASVVYYDNNATAFDKWGNLKFVGGIPGYSITNLFSTAKRKADPSKLPVIVLNGKEVSVEELQVVFTNKTLRGTYLVKMQDAPALEKYGQKGKNGVLFTSTKMGYPDNYLYLYEGKEITNEEAPRYEVGKTLSWRVLVGKTAEEQYGEKAKFGVVIINTKRSESALPDTIFGKATQPAIFPGGEEGLKKYLAENLRYPAAARKNKTEGTVQVDVIVDSTGAVLRALARHYPGDGLMEEAARILREGPAWIPAKQNGRAVAYRIVVPVVFKLDPVSYF